MVYLLSMTPNRNRFSKERTAPSSNSSEIDRIIKISPTPGAWSANSCLSNSHAITRASKGIIRDNTSRFRRSLASSSPAEALASNRANSSCISGSSCFVASSNHAKAYLSGILALSKETPSRFNSSWSFTCVAAALRNRHAAILSPSTADHASLSELVSGSATSVIGLTIGVRSIGIRHNYQVGLNAQGSFAHRFKMAAIFDCSFANSDASNRMFSMGSDAPHSVAKHIATSSAMNPSLILCATVSPLCFALSAWTASNGYFVAACVPLAIACFQIIWFTFFDRDRLQNDRHVENKMMIMRDQITINSPDGTRTITLPSSSVLTSNTAAIEAPNGGGDE